MLDSFQGVFEKRNVLVTGHTGFKGSWLAIWLKELGAQVVGYSKAPSSHPSNFALSKLAEQIHHIEGDVCDFDSLQKIMENHGPEILFHLAAQPIVLHGYRQPKETFDVNAGGTVNILEAARHCPSLKAVIIVTTDKCYENQEWWWGYRENDRLGGSDPYSASKSMAELAVQAYRSSFFSEPGKPLVASARAGNVIGGGDFSDYRIVPDSMKALMNKEPIKVRNPSSVRPWLYMLDALSGYLCLAERLLQGGKPFAEAWNFGPIEQQAVDVESLVDKAIELWGGGDWVNLSPPQAKPEMGLLRINWDKAANLLGWKPAYDWEDAIKGTVSWFKAFDKGRRPGSCADMHEMCIHQINEYTERAQGLNIPWARCISTRSFA